MNIGTMHIQTMEITNTVIHSMHMHIINTFKVNIIISICNMRIIMTIAYCLSTLCAPRDTTNRQRRQKTLPTMARQLGGLQSPPCSPGSLPPWRGENQAPRPQQWAIGNIR